MAALMEAAFSVGRRDDAISAFQSDVVASCVGPVTAAAFEMWGVPTIVPDHSRLTGWSSSWRPSCRRGGTASTYASIGTKAVVTVVKRGYRLAVA